MTILIYVIMTILIYVQKFRISYSLENLGNIDENLCGCPPTHVQNISF